MVLPFSREVGEENLSLLMNIDHAQVTEYPPYLPLNISESLKSWLSEAVIGGRANNLSLLYHGSVSRDPTIEPSYQFSADFSELSLRSHEEWPTLTAAEGYFLLDSNHVSARVESAKSMGVAVSGVVVDTVEFSDGKGLDIRATLRGQSSAAKQFLLSSPVRVNVGDFLPYWHLKGNYHAELRLGIPFSFDEEAIEYRVDVNVSDNSIYLESLDLNLSKVSGQFQYSSASGFQSDRLEFDLWDKPFSSRANSDNHHQDIVFNIDGRLNTAAFSSWAKRPEFIFFRGDTDVQGQLSIPTSDASALGGVELELSSFLEGLELDLPEPFLKQKKQRLAQPAILTITSVDDLLHYDYQHADLFEVDVWSNESDLPYVSLKFGSALEAEDLYLSDWEPLPAKAGQVEIHGSLADANYETWSMVIDRFLEAEAALGVPEIEQETENMIVSTNIDVRELDFFDVPITDINVKAQSKPDLTWLIDVKSEMLKGRVTLPPDESPVDINLDYFSVELEESTADPILIENDLAVLESAFSDVDLESVGNLRVNIRKLMIDNVDWGNWSFVTSEIEQGVLFSDFKATVRKLRIGHTAPSQFFWFKRGEEHSSRFIGSVETDDVGAALEAWDFDRLLSSKSASFMMDIAWDAEPDMIALPLLYGDVSLDIQNGSFLRGAEAGENPLLRLLALFNFDTLARRIRLDFSDLAAKGFAYDSVKTDLHFDEGVALFQSPLIVESSSSKMRMVGAVDLIEEEIDAELVVTLPVAGNLAVAAAFAAGLPAGLGVYIISKMFNKHVDKVSSISYSVDGPWEDPKVKVRRVFNNKTRKKDASEFSRDRQIRETLVGQPYDARP